MDCAVIHVANAKLLHELAVDMTVSPGELALYCAGLCTMWSAHAPLVSRLQHDLRFRRHHIPS